MTYIVELDRQNGGSGSNMAIDLKRLDRALPVEAMGSVVRMPLAVSEATAA